MPLETGELAVPEDGPVAWTAHADLAEVAALALTGDDLDGLTPALTGSDEIDLAGIAENRLGADRALDPPGRRAGCGLPGRRARRWVAGTRRRSILGMFVASRQHELAPADPTLERLIDREAVSLRDVLKDALPPSR